MDGPLHSNACSHHQNFSNAPHKTYPQRRQPTQLRSLTTTQTPWLRCAQSSTTHVHSPGRRARGAHQQNPSHGSVRARDSKPHSPAAESDRERARLRSYGQTQVPAYLVDLHLTNASGQPPDCRVTEAWARALVPDDAIEAVHEVPSLRAVSYVWLADSDFNPVAAPVAMFANLPAA